MLALLLWPLNFGISWYNAHVTGNVWDAAKAKGGMAYFMTWMGAVMAASGFTWCLLLPLGLIGTQVPMQIFADEGEVLPGVLFEPDTLQAFYGLGYMVIIFPILGSGLAITVHAWRSLARRRAEGTAGAADYAIAGWDTFAQIHNTYSAVRHIPGILDMLGGFFSSKSSSSSGGSKKGNEIVMIAVVMAVIAAVTGGIIMTYGIIQSRRRAVAYDETLRRAAQS